MFGVRGSEDYQPLTWIGRLPIYVTSLLVVLYTASMFALVIASTAKLDPSFLSFQPSDFLSGAIWQPFTCTFTCTFVDGPDFFYLLALIFFYQAGVEVEKYIGRKKFLGLFLALLLAPAIWLSALYILKFPVGSYVGNYQLTAAMFVALATLYPNMEWFASIPLKWIAIAGLFLASLMYLPNHQWASLSVLWLLCGLSFAYIRVLQHGGISSVAANLPSLMPVRRRVPVATTVRRSRQASSETVEMDVVESINPLLDKIAEHGMASLTPSERQTLENARLALLKKH